MKHVYTTLTLAFGTCIGLLIGSAGPALAKGSILSSSKAKMNSSTYKIEVDSLRYTYSAGRGGDLETPGGVPFDSCVSYWYAVTMGPPTIKRATVKHYNAVGLVDTESVYWQDRTINVYDAAGKLSQQDYQTVGAGNTWVPLRRQFLYYNVAGADSLNLAMLWNAAGSAWQLDGRTRWTYDGSGNVTQVLGEDWSSASSAWVGVYRSTSSYNGAGLVTSEVSETWSAGTSSWRPNQRRRYYYSGIIKTTQVVERLSSAGAVTSVDSFLYSSSGSPVTTVALMYLKPNAASPFSLYQRTTITTTSAANPSVHTTESWNGSSWQNAQRTSFTYNGDEQLIRQYLETWNGSAWAYQPFVSYEMRNYYSGPTGIAGNPGKASAAPDLSLSPVPASGAISLVVTASLPQAFEARITDLNGKILRTWSRIAQTERHVETVSIADLLPGIYYMSISSREGAVSRAFIVR